MDPLPDDRGTYGAAVPNGGQSLARRRRHAWLLAALAELIGDCAHAAGAVYGPVAEAGPTQTDVAVDLGPLADLCRSAHTRVDAAHARDAARRPASVTPPGRPLTPYAAGALADLGADFLTELPDRPAQAVARVRELADEGGFTVDQILDEAVDTAVLSGLLSLHEAQLQSDPGTAAAKCLAATGHFAMAVSVMSVDVTIDATVDVPNYSAASATSAGTSRTTSVSSPELMS